MKVFMWISRDLYRLLLLAAVPTLLLAACQMPDKQANPAAYVGAYAGTVPCADCEGIEYRIQLGEDGRFVSTAIYLGKASQPFRSEGEYTLDDEGLLVLNAGMDNQQYFAPDADGLWWLDREGKRIEGNLAAHYRLTRIAGNLDPNAPGSGELDTVRTEPAEGSDFYLRKWQEGITFYALGNEPFWALDWKRNEGWIFQTAEGEVLKLGSTEPVYLADSGLTRYSFQTKTQTVRVTLKDEPCTDGMSGAPFDLNIAISIVSGGNDEPRLYRGCGSFTADPRLHNIWALVNLEGRSVNAANYPRGVPSLELNLATRRVYGFDGCNRFSGSLTAGPQGLRFNPMLGTLMACPGEMALYQLSSLLSNSEVSYSWNAAGHLVFRKAGKAWAEFRPVD